MQPSEIQEILDKDIPSTQEDLVHYYVNVEGESTLKDELSSQQGMSTNIPRHISEFLRLPQMSISSQE